MRLINADDLIITVLTHDLCDAEQIDKDILEAPTVEAIPIEWIKKYAKKGGRLTNILFPFEIEMMLDDWEKENE